MRSSSQPGLIVRQPSASTRWRSTRSALITTTSSPRPRAAAASVTMAASPSREACTVRRWPSRPRGTPAFAWPSSTSTISSYDVSATASRPCRRAAAPGRSRHHPSGRDPTTFAPSTTSTVLMAESSGSSSEEVLAAEHLGRRAAAGRAGVEVGTSVEEQAHHLVLTLEQGARDRGLVTVVAPVQVRPTVQQHRYRGGLAVVGGQHEQRVAVGVLDVHGQPVVDETGQLLGHPLADEVQRELHDTGRLLGVERTVGRGHAGSTSHSWCSPGSPLSSTVSSSVKRRSGASASAFMISSVTSISPPSARAATRAAMATLLPK